MVLSVAVKFPFASRYWALPVLVALYRPEELNRAEGRRHKTPAQLGRQLMAVLIHWFPGRKFVLLGDGGYASHELARFCHRHRRAADDALVYTRPLVGLSSRRQSGCLDSLAAGAAPGSGDIGADRSEGAGPAAGG